MAINAINSLEFGSNQYVFTLPYGECSTPGDTQAKTVTVENFSLETGVRVLVKFTVDNTAIAPTLAVNSTTAKSIMYRGSAISSTALKANRIYEFVYDGTDWELIGDLDSTSFIITAEATDDNVVILTGASGSNKVTYDAKHAKKGPSNGYTSDNTTTFISGWSGSGTIKVPQITVDAYGHVTAAADESVTITLPAKPTVSNTTTTSTATVKPGSDKKTTFKAVSEVGASEHTVSDVETTFTLDLSDFATVNELSTAMVFKGSLGTKGTITALPTASASTVGDTYKVITADTYANISAKVGDVFVCSDKPEWVLIPSGDEPTGTVTSIEAGTGLTGGTITSSGTIAHASTSRTDTTSTATPAAEGTFTVVDSVTTNTLGHITAVNVKTVTLPEDKDTHYTSKNIVGTSSSATANGAVTGNGVYLNHLEQTNIKSTHKITGSGLTKVTSDTSGNITITTPTTATELGYTPTSPEHTHTITPAGTVSKPSFSGTEATISTKYTPAGTVAAPTFTGTEVTTGNPTGTASVATAAHTHSYTPAGSVSQPKFTGSEVTSATPTGATSVINSHTPASLTATVESKCLKLTFTADTSTSTNVASTGHTHKVTAAGTVSTPTFSGTAATIETANNTTNVVSVASSTHTHKVTAAGTNSAPGFTGTEATISTKYTPAGSVSQPTFTGSSGTTSAAAEA